MKKWRPGIFKQDVNSLIVRMGKQSTYLWFIPQVFTIAWAEPRPNPGSESSIQVS